LQGGPSEKGPNRNELLLKNSHLLKDVSKLATTIANYISKFLLTTRIFHLEGEEVFRFTKHNAHFLLGADDESHRLDHVNFSHPCVVVPTYQPNSVDDLFILRSPCVAQSMFPIFFQGGIMVNEIMCGDGIWHIDRCPPNYVVQCFALQENIDLKCTCKINTHKTTSRTPTPCYFGF
jgi:hypothetical protein